MADGLLTPQNIVDYSQDILDVMAWANGDKNYIQTFRLGEQVPSPANQIGSTNLTNWTGPWDVGTSYAINDIAEDGGTAYAANTANVGDQPPSANWDVYSAKGADGLMTSVVGGTGITVDAGDPANPIVNADFAELFDDPSPTLSDFLDPAGNYIGRDKGTGIADSATPTIPTDGGYFEYAGTTTTTAFTVANNRSFTLKHTGSRTLTASASIVTIDGNDLVLVAGQTVTFQSTAANVVQVVNVGTAPVVPVDTATKELWFPVLAINDGVGDNTFPYTLYGGTPGDRRMAAAAPDSTSAIYINVIIPHDFNSLTDMVLITVPNTTETIQADIHSEYGQVGEPRNTHIASLLDDTFAAVANQIMEWSISGVIPSATAGDRVGLQISSDTTELLIMGLRLKYT